MIAIDNHKKLIGHYLCIVKILEVSLMNGVEVSGYYDCFFLHVNTMSAVCLSLLFKG